MEEVTLVRADATLRGTVVGAGPAVLLLHAGRERRRVWGPVVASLAPRGLRTVAYDLRGHGESTGSATALPAFAADVAAMIHREPAPVVVVGASLGGVAAIAALADPLTAERVAGVILVDAVPEPEPARVRAWLDRNGLLDGHLALIEDLLGRGPELQAAAAGIAAPIHLVRAGRSPLTDDDERHLRAVRPSLTVSAVPEAGHLIARDAPGRLADVIADRASAWLGGT